MTLRRALWVLLFSILVPCSGVSFPGGVASAADLAPGGGAVVIADALNLRAGPGVENPAVDVLPSGTTLRLLAGPTDDIWWRVTDGSRVGYVSGQWLAPAEPPVDAAFDLDLPLPYHRQMTSIWCDPADIQSWIEYDQGRPMGDSAAVQQKIWEWELSHNAGFTEDQWDASPYAVASAAHQWLPDRGFNHFIYDDPVAATDTIGWLLANPKYGEPSIALIWRGDHYILVRGIRATTDPFKNPDARVLGVYVMDPNQAGRSWLGEDRYIPMSDWVNSFLTPVSYLTPHTGLPGDPWQEKYVTIQRDWGNEGPTLGGRVDASPGSYQAPSQ
jgi:hypothetical protein